MRRNRRHCLKIENPIVKTKEDDAEIIEISDDEEHNEVDDKDHNEVDDKDLVNIEVCNDDELSKQLTDNIVRTRSGRISNKPSRYNDYVK